MEAKKVMDSVFSYLEKNMVPGMSDIQEVAFYAIKEAVNEEYDKLLETIKGKPLVRAIAAIDKDGDVDVDKLAKRIRKGLESKGSITFDVPLYGSIRFVPNDIDNILADLKEDSNNENHQNFGGTY